MGSLTSHLTDILNEYGSWDNYMKEKDKEKKGFSKCAEETPKYNWTTTTTFGDVKINWEIQRKNFYTLQQHGVVHVHM